MKTLARTTITAALIATAFIAGQSHGRKLEAAAAVNDEFTAQMYESDEDARMDAARQSGHAAVFMAGFDYAVKHADEILNGGN